MNLMDKPNCLFASASEGAGRAKASAGSVRAKSGKYYSRNSVQGRAIRIKVKAI